ncbi:MAG: WYL domain-containing protein [Hyphomicrobium sp.]|uniref:WYL domain-containing protein n=1 Tax=Hyphomicrobium sp. TaxID=82 RepID=UPI0025BC41D1|nr:WYL domain-containing protein [Hyphomicrobium sp.]MBX9864946.1 WYL domain-containing protein [Hyphomicrobium sp.]
MPAKLKDVPPSQVERLSFIEARLYFLGELRRADVAKRFSRASIQASRDLALYKELAPGNLAYDFQAKTYLPGEKFKLIFGRTPERVMYWLRSGLGDGLPHPQGLPTAAVESLSQPRLGELAVVTRAIYRRQILEVTYVSLSSGNTRRQIVPHALVDNGQRWHVRAYDRNNSRFSDFVITRLSKAVVIDAGDAARHERGEADEQWNRTVELKLIPHPNLKHKGAVEADYGMRSGALLVKCRAAVAGYALRRWGVDCSQDHCLSETEFQLALANHQVLASIDSSALAPGRERQAASRNEGVR